MKNEISKSNYSDKDKKKFLIVKRYDISMDKQGKIFGQIKNYIKSQKIFEFNEKIKLGKLEVLKGPRFDKDKKLIPYSFVGDKYFVTQRREAIKNVTSFLRQSHRLDKINKDFSKIKSEGDLYSKYYKTYTKLITNNNINSEKEDIKPLPKFIKKNLEKQERVLKRFGTFENFEEIIRNKLLKKNDKNKKDLLLKINDLSSSTTKYIKTDDINPNLKNWNFKLRNPKIKGIYKRKGYFKATSLNEDLYSIINLNKDKQIFVNPFKINLNNNKKNSSLNKRTTREENLGALKLRGKNILEKALNNRRKINKIIDNNQSFKSSSFRLNKNFSFVGENEKNLSQNYDDRVFAFNYDLKYKYDKKENITKFHN